MNNGVTAGIHELIKGSGLMKLDVPVKTCWF